MASRHDNPAAFWTSRSGVPLFFVQKGVTHDHVRIDHSGWPAARQARHAQSLLAQPKEGLAAGNEVSGAARMQVITGDVDSVADPELRELLQQCPRCCRRHCIRSVIARRSALETPLCPK